MFGAQGFETEGETPRACPKRWAPCLHSWDHTDLAELEVRREHSGDASPVSVLHARAGGRGMSTPRDFPGWLGRSSPPCDRGGRTPPCGLRDTQRTCGRTAGTRAPLILPVLSDCPGQRRS